VNHIHPNNTKLNNTKEQKLLNKNKVVATTKTNFEEYKNELRLRFPLINFDYEYEKFELYYSDKKPKNPKLALLRWFTKADEDRIKNSQDNDPNKYLKGKYAHMVRR